MRINGLKICGISDPETALYCEGRGVGAVGVVFFPKSPRNVSAEQAARVLAPLGPEVGKVGVFVNMPVAELLAVAATAGLTTVQMHGDESASDIQAVRQAGYRVVKVLKSSGKKLLENADSLPSGTGIMVELSAGALPGGNGAPWNWSSAAILSGRHDFALAGGLTAHNLNEARIASGAIAFDLSSAVESAPGVKDRDKIDALIRAASKLQLNRIFWR